MKDEEVEHRVKDSPRKGKKAQALQTEGEGRAEGGEGL